MNANRTQPLRLAVLVSGGGTNLQALLDRQAAGSLAAEVVAVISDRADAQGLVRAQKAQVPAHVVDYRAHLQAGPDRIVEHGFPVDLRELDRRQRILRHADPEQRLRRLGRLVLAEQELIGVLDRYRPDFICLAGFMRLVSPYFLSHYRTPDHSRILNIHPALLPAFPGQHGYEDTFAYGCKWGGITVHFVDEGEDSGPIIAQAVYPVRPEDDLQQVRRRGLELEYEVYAQCINWLAAGQIELQRHPSSRLRVLITDPLYPVILKAWLEKAFSL